MLKQGLKVLNLERETFPRFSIGERLLPQTFLKEAGLLRAVVQSGFQHKEGAVFERGPKRKVIDGHDKISEGWSTACQLQRGRFDKVLADAAEALGADIRYGHETLAANVSGDRPVLNVRGPDGVYAVTGRFLLDASGFERVLAGLLGLETPSALSPTACTRSRFTVHVRKASQGRA